VSNLGVDVGENHNGALWLMAVLGKIFGVAWYFLVASSAFGQAAVAEYSVDGVVRNAVTGAPVRNALVLLDQAPDPNQLNDPPPEESKSMPTKATLSGRGGEFHFDGLPAGYYHHSARMPDYLEDEYSEKTADFVVPRPPSDGPVQINLTPFGAIQGSVFDQFGEPLEKVLVIVSFFDDENGSPTTREIGRVRTDDLGHYLLTRVQPGKAYIRALGRDGGTETHVDHEKTRYATWESFAPVYSDGATDLALAAPIEIAPGAIVQADFHIDLQRAFRISGKLEGYRVPESVRFGLLRGNEAEEAERAVLDGATGQFEILDVLPGTYTLRATQGETRGEVSVTVTNRDLGGVSIPLVPGVTIHGSSHFVGSTPRSIGSCDVVFHPRRGLDSEFSGSAPTDGPFSIQGVFPGEYRVGVHCSLSLLSGASFGNADLLTNPDITISPGPVPPIEITVQAGGTLKATFANEPTERGAMLLVPSLATLTEPRWVVTQESSFFSKLAGVGLFGSLVPGDYTLYGFSKLADVPSWDPAFVQSLSGGTTVHVEDGQTVEVTITGISK
jgi:hypothetical protein